MKPCFANYSCGFYDIITRRICISIFGLEKSNFYPYLEILQIKVLIFDRTVHFPQCRIWFHYFPTMHNSEDSVLLKEYLVRGYAL